MGDIVRNGALSGVGFWLALWFLINIAVIGCFEVFALRYLTTEETVSHHLRRWVTALPVLALLVGIVLGHLFFPLPPPALPVPPIIP